jgi:hypothetical protein
MWRCWISPDDKRLQLSDAVAETSLILTGTSSGGTDVRFAAEAARVADAIMASGG